MQVAHVFPSTFWCFTSTIIKLKYLLKYIFLNLKCFKKLLIVAKWTVQQSPHRVSGLIDVLPIYLRGPLSWAILSPVRHDALLGWLSSPPHTCRRQAITWWAGVVILIIFLQVFKHACKFPLCRKKSKYKHICFLRSSLIIAIVVNYWCTCIWSGQKQDQTLFGSVIHVKRTAIQSLVH